MQNKASGLAHERQLPAMGQGQGSGRGRSRSRNKATEIQAGNMYLSHRHTPLRGLG
jgi:hypothetical protein